MNETEADRKFIASMELLRKRHPPKEKSRWWPVLLGIVFVLATYIFLELLK